MDFVQTVQDSAFAVWVRESPSIFAYTTILALHAMGLAIVVGLNVMVALRLLGMAEGIPLAETRKLFPWMYFGFTINALSGLALLAANFTNDITNWMFILKLVLIALAMVNLEVTRSRVIEPAVASGAENVLDSGRRFAYATLVVWSAAIIAGRLTEYPAMVAAWFD